MGDLGKDPDRIILTFHEDPATSRAVTWRTDHTVKSAMAQIAEATVNSKFVKNAITIDAVTEPLIWVYIKVMPL